MASRLHNVLRQLSSCDSVAAPAHIATPWHSTSPVSARADTSKPDSAKASDEFDSNASFSRVERKGVTAVAAPLAQNADGSITADALVELHERELAAAASGEYRLAAQLRDLREVLGPRPPLTLEQASPAGVDEQYEFFLQNGFLVVPRVLVGERLLRAQRAYAAAMAEPRHEWEQERARGEGIGREGGLRWATGSDAYRTFYSGKFTDLMAEDDVFLDLVDSPKLLPVLMRVVGLGGLAEDGAAVPAVSPYNGMARSGGMTPRVVPSEDK